jgi:hypothetical protein
MGGIRDLTAPLSAGAFDRVSDCELERQHQIDLETQYNERNRRISTQPKIMGSARCIATDDPRSFSRWDI